jgi:hypothetical protein
MSEHDLSEFFAETAKHGPSCSMAVVIEALPDEQKDKLGAALVQGDIPSTAIARVVSKWAGQKIAAPTVRRHRKGECGCG